METRVEAEGAAERWIPVRVSRGAGPRGVCRHHAKSLPLFRSSLDRPRQRCAKKKEKKKKKFDASADLTLTAASPTRRPSFLLAGAQAVEGDDRGGEVEPASEVRGVNAPS